MKIKQFTKAFKSEFRPILINVEEANEDYDKEIGQVTENQQQFETNETPKDELK